MDSPKIKPPHEDLIITLVHGTWFPSAQWARESSKLRIFLEQRLADRYNLRFEIFQWHGDFGLPFNNSHHHRIRAGEQLCEKLIQLQEHYPTATHFVIAHSHGGNVALYAMRDPDVQRQVSGLILYGAVISALVLGGIWLAVMLVPCFVLAFVLFYFFPGKAAALLWLGACCAWIPLAASGWPTSHAEKKIGFLLARPKSWVKNKTQAFIKRWHQKLELTLDAIGVPDASEVPVLCIMSEADEAFGSLSLLNILSELPFKAWNCWAYLALFVLLCVSLLFPTGSTTLAGGPSLSMGAIGSSFGMAAFIVSFIAACHALVLSLVAYLRYPGFGFEAWMSSALAQIGISRTPAGESGSYEIRSYPYSRRAFLNHSALYIDDKPLSDIANWLLSRLTA